MFTGLITLTVEEPVRVHSLGWLAGFASAVLEVVEPYAAKNDPDVIAVVVQMVTTDNVLLTDGELGAMRRLLEGFIMKCDSEIEIAEIMQERHPRGILNVTVSVYT